MMASEIRQFPLCLSGLELSFAYEFSLNRVLFPLRAFNRTARPGGSMQCPSVQAVNPGIVCKGNNIA